MRKCIKCNKNLDDSFFVKRKIGINHICKNCFNIYQRNHYIKNRQYYIDKASVSRKKSVLRNMSYLIEYCKTHPCVGCGEDDFIVLHFDHVRGDKNTEIARMCTGSLKKIKEELKKCDVRCGNCHMRKTAEQLSYYKYIKK
jgi:hypothetical protein